MTNSIFHYHHRIFFFWIFHELVFIFVFEISSLSALFELSLKSGVWILIFFWLMLWLSAIWFFVFHIEIIFLKKKKHNCLLTKILLRCYQHLCQLRINLKIKNKLISIGIFFLKIRNILIVIKLIFTIMKIFIVTLFELKFFWIIAVITLSFVIIQWNSDIFELRLILSEFVFFSNQISSYILADIEFNQIIIDCVCVDKSAKISSKFDIYVVVY